MAVVLRSPGLRAAREPGLRAAREPGLQKHERIAISTNHSSGGCSPLYALAVAPVTLPTVALSCTHSSTSRLNTISPSTFEFAPITTFGTRGLPKENRLQLCD